MKKGIIIIAIVILGVCILNIITDKITSESVNSVIEDLQELKENLETENNEEIKIPMKKVEEKVDENNEIDGHQFTYEQNITIDYVKKFEILDADDAKELRTKLEEYLTPVQAVKVVDLMPEDLDDLRLIFAKERGTFETDALKNILDLLDQYR